MNLRYLQSRTWYRTAGIKAEATEQTMGQQTVCRCILAAGHRLGLGNDRNATVALLPKQFKAIFVDLPSRGLPAGLSWV